MIACPKCFSALKEDDQFCKNCNAPNALFKGHPTTGTVGDSLAYECDACGADVSFEDRVCQTCGADISEVDDGTEEENAENLGVQAKPNSPAVTTGTGIVVLVIGVALIIISPNLLFTQTVGHSDLGFVQLPITQTTDLRAVSLFFGVALLIVGGIVSAVGFSKAMSTNRQSYAAPTTLPVLAHSISPKSVELGNTPDEVQSVMGQPDKIINLGARVIHVYKDMKIIYVDGKVSDVQLS